MSILTRGTQRKQSIESIAAIVFNGPHGCSKHRPRRHSLKSRFTQPPGVLARDGKSVQVRLEAIVEAAEVTQSDVGRFAQPGSCTVKNP
jgi:hypothetical protein